MPVASQGYGENEHGNDEHAGGFHFVLLQGRTPQLRRLLCRLM